MESENDGNLAFLEALVKRNANGNKSISQTDSYGSIIILPYQPPKQSQTVTHPNPVQKIQNSPQHSRTKKAKRNLSLQGVREKRMPKELRKKDRAHNEPGNRQKGIVKLKDHSPINQNLTWISRKIIPTSRNSSCSQATPNFENIYFKTINATEDRGKNKCLRSQVHGL